MVKCGKAVAQSRLVAVMADKDESIRFDASDDAPRTNAEFDSSLYRFLIVPDVALSKIRCVEKYLDSIGAYFYSENGYGFCTEAPREVFGRIMQIESIEPFAPKTLKRRLRELDIRRADIMRREFPLSCDQIASQARHIAGRHPAHLLYENRRSAVPDCAALGNGHEAEHRKQQRQQQQKQETENKRHEASPLLLTLRQRVGNKSDDKPHQRREHQRLQKNVQPKPILRLLPTSPTKTLSRHPAKSPKTSISTVISLCN
ncbi:MAG: hypothetical protein L6V35_00495 [Alistipes putredinis]|nr:MAG: hypothetical protein L6V35_00495 [Alistipes putredinis]